MRTKITISEPCNENWNEMTPTEKGAFCSVCTKEVKDFTKSSDDEIEQTLKAAQDQVCGRFKVSQLNRPLNKSTSTVFEQLMIPFAASFLLMSCETQGQIMKGEVARENSHNNNLPQDTSAFSQDSMESKLITLGNVMPLQQVCTKELMGDVIYKEPIENGKVAFLDETVEGDVELVEMPEMNDSNNVETEVLTGDTIVSEIPIQLTGFVSAEVEIEPIEIKTESLIMGGMAYHEVVYVDPIDSIPSPSGNIPTTTQIETPDEISAIAFPNPTTGLFKIQFEETASYNILVIDQTGKAVYKRNLMGGNVQIDISNHPDGMYYVQITSVSGEERKIIKVVKKR